MTKLIKTINLNEVDPDKRLLTFSDLSIPKANNNQLLRIFNYALFCQI